MLQPVEHQIAASEQESKRDLEATHVLSAAVETEGAGSEYNSDDDSSSGSSSEEEVEGEEDLSPFAKAKIRIQVKVQHHIWG